MLKETQWIKFFSDCSCYIMNEEKTFVISGNRKLAEASGNILSKSKKLYDLLCNENSSVKEIQSAILEKKKAAQIFYRETDIQWPF